MVGIVIGWRDVKLGDNGQEMQYEKKGEDSEVKTHELTVYYKLSKAGRTAPISTTVALP